tara:strand:+ start:1040 stop:1654 length:615 start_codon:yes stop_codon:yes gene_type:complete
VIGIIDYGMGNLFSVKNSLNFLGEDSILCYNSDDLNKVDKIILPGVGAFPDCIRNLKKRELIDSLNYNVMQKKTPILGICLGMQAMATISYELEKTDGLGWIDAEVIPLESDNNDDKIPNIGWENIEFSEKTQLMSGFALNPDFYFVHSYFMQCNDTTDIDSWYYYGKQKVTASIQKQHIFGTQFHPEKSSEFGLQVLINFIDY